MEVQERIQKSTFINESLTPSESRDVINNLLDCYTNFLKLQHLSQWEKNHKVNGIDKKTERLNTIRKELLEQIQEARLHGRCLQLKGSLALEMI